GRLSAVARAPFSGRLRGDGGDDPAPRARRGRGPPPTGGGLCGRWVPAREGAGLGIDPGRLAVGGDSAGANLALAAALALRDTGERALGFMLLIYGCFSTDTESQSWQRFGRGAGLSQIQMRWIWESYLERPE